MNKRNLKWFYAFACALFVVGAGTGVWFFNKKNEQVFPPPMAITPRPQDKDAKISASTDKSVYRHGEDISVTFINNSDRDIYCMAATQAHNSGETLYRRVGREWQVVFTEKPCPGCQLESVPLSILRAGKSVAYVWKPLIYDNFKNDLVFLEKAVYRLGIAYQYELGIEGFEAMTNEFEITE